MANKKFISKILLIVGIVLVVIGFTLSVIHIPLSKEEAQALFDACMECNEPPTYRNLDPNITLPIFFSGFPVIASGLIIRYVI